MADSQEVEKYDEMLTSILVNEKSIIGFLSTIFNFLARRTDFYYVPDGEYENMGFPPGVAEELVVKVLRNCDPKNWSAPNGAAKPLDMNNEIMCSTVAQEVEIVAEEDKVEEPDQSEMSHITQALESQSVSDSNSTKSMFPEDYEPPVIRTQKNSEAYNGATRENYTWSQTIVDLDVIVKLPPTVKSSTDLKVTLTFGDICVQCSNGDTIIKDSLPYRIKTSDSFWGLTEGGLLIHLEKLRERWWDRLLVNEEPIDLDKIDCSRPLDELPEDHIAKVRELQWNQEQKMKGLPTSDEIRNIEILKKAWNAEGSPFKGQEFDPSVLRRN